MTDSQLIQHNDRLHNRHKHHIQATNNPMLAMMEQPSQSIPNRYWYPMGLHNTVYADVQLCDHVRGVCHSDRSDRYDHYGHYGHCD